MDWYIKVWKQYADFSGRARRKEYWMFALMNFLLNIGFMFVFGIIIGIVMSITRSHNVMTVFSGILVFLIIAYSLALLIPSLAVTVRRLHDIDKSGWNILLGLIPIVGSIILIVYYVQEGTAGDNQYGPDPKAAERQGSTMPPPRPQPQPRPQPAYRPVSSANDVTYQRKPAWESENKSKRMEIEGYSIETDMTCQRCGRSILSRHKFVSELNKHGLTLDSRTNSITASGTFGGYADLQKLQRLSKRMEDITALKCNSCGKIYCLICLVNYAPQHPTTGGKACFSCGGSINYAY